MIHHLNFSSRGGGVDGFANTHIRAATAYIARHRGIDIGIVRMGRGRKQRRRRHDLSRLAIAALDDFEIEPSFLNLCANGRLANSFNRRHRTIADSVHAKNARAHGISIEMSNT